MAERGSEAHGQVAAQEVAGALSQVQAHLDQVSAPHTTVGCGNRARWIMVTIRFAVMAVVVVL